MNAIKTTVAPVSAIADVLALWNEDGWLTPPLQPIVPAAAPVMGRALTITITTGTEGPGFARIYDVLSADLTDRVLVLAGAHAVPGAVWGEILTRAAIQQGASGVLVDGFVRDRPATSALGIPMYAQGECVVGPYGRAHVTAVDDPVEINGATVHTNDLIVMDVTGCVRVPAERMNEVLQAAHRYVAGEDLVVKALNEGEPLARAYRHKRTITQELKKGDEG